MLKGGDGREGLITFAGGHWYPQAPLVGVFHDVHSSRYNNVVEADLEQFFKGCPSYQRSLAEQAALPFLCLEYNGKVLHHVTGAFWDKEELLTAADDWEIMLENGVDLLNREMIEDWEEALAGFQVDYGMSHEQVAFARSLFERKMARPPARIELSRAEVEWLESASKDRTGVTACREKLAELDILFPDRPDC